MRPELSIIIAVRDNWRQLSECLESLEAQFGPPSTEVIIVDDGSKTPAPPEITAKTKITVGVHRQVGIGRAAARNRGITLARGEMILFLDSDCRMEPHCLGHLAAAVRHFPDDVAFQLSLSCPGITPAQKVEAARLHAVQEALLLTTGHISYAATAGFAVRASYAMQNEPLFDASVIRGSDTLLLGRLIEQGKRPRFLPSCTVYHCPAMSFRRYALRHYWIGYHDYFARKQLESLGGVLMGWTDRGRMFRRIWRASPAGKERVWCIAGVLVCYGIERGGRVASRLWHICPRKRNPLAALSMTPRARRHDVARSLRIPSSAPGITTVPRASRGRGNARIQLLHCPIDFVTMDGVVAQVLDWCQESRRSHRLVTMNAATLVMAQSEPSLLDACVAADLVIPDGVSLVWASHLVGRPLPERIAGVDLMARLLEVADRRRLRVFFLGATQKVVTQLVVRCTEQFPRLVIAGYRDGYFGEDAYKEVISQIRASGIHILFIGMPSPFKEVWAERYRADLGVPVIFGVGGSFDVLAGFIRRAPKWMQAVGLEWFWRLMMEPRRLWRRYLVTNSLFLLQLFKAVLSRQRLGR